MAGRQTALSVLVVLVALAVFHQRSNLAGRKRTTQSNASIKSSPFHQEYEVEIKQRADYSKPGPYVSAVIQTIGPKTRGAYKGRPGSPPAHIHPYDDEEFTIIEGAMAYICDGKEGTLNQGETATLPAGSLHTFWNTNPDSVLKQQVKLINRSGKFSASERFFEQWFAVAYDYGGVERVNPLQIFLTLEAGNIEPGLPKLGRLFLSYIVLPIGRLLGFRGIYPEYILP